MKKIFGIILLMITFALGALAQNGTTDAKLKYDQTFIEYNGDSGDIIGTTDSVWTYTVQKEIDGTVTPYIYVDADSTGTSGNVLFILQQKVFGDESYTAIDTVTWTQSSSDTTFTINPSTATEARFHRIVMQGSLITVDALINNLDFYFVK